MSGRPGRGVLLSAVAALVATSAVSVSIYLDPPVTNRARAFDHRRMAALSELQSAIGNYYRSHAALPPDLRTVERAAALAVQTDRRDPVSNEVYAYEITGPASYRLCATFDRPSDDRDSAATYTRAHGAGRVCFEHDEALTRSQTGALHVLMPTRH